MADEGLFSNLKFTDIAIPLAGTIASAWNPHIGRGLQSGMNIFNSMAAFQNDIRKWKMYNEEQKMLKEEMERGRGAVGEHLGSLEGRQQELRRRFSEQTRDELDYPQGPHGATIAQMKEPMSEEDFQAAMAQQIQGGQDEGRWALGVSPEAQAGLVGDPAGQFQEQMAATAPPKFSEAAPWYLEQQVERGLFDDPEYQSLNKEIMLSKLMGGTMGLSPGSSVSTLGYSALASQNAAQEKQRLLENIAAYDEYGENEILRKERDRRLRLSGLEEEAQIWNEKKKVDFDNWLQTSQQLSSLNAEDLENMNALDAFKLMTTTGRLLQQASVWGEAANPVLVAGLEGLMMYLQTKVPGLAGGAGATGGQQPEGATPGANAVLSMFGGG